MSRPQKITDDEIVAVIAALRAANLPATGVDVRRELLRRFGVRAGTDRVYRLLKTSPPAIHPTPPQPLLDALELLRERDEALRRAQLAVYREEATQSRTALEIDTLRQRLRALGVDPFGPPAAPGSRFFPV